MSRVPRGPALAGDGTLSSRSSQSIVRSEIECSPVHDDKPLHRKGQFLLWAKAFPDAYVTAHHLRDMLNLASLDQLLEWSRESGLLPRVPAGSERGKNWRDISDDALEHYSKDRDPDVRFSAETEQRRRGNAIPETERPRQGRLL